MAEVLLKRCLVAAGVILGVLLLCFLLFRVAAGDPAAALLGKNPRPEEVESLRREMGTDLPLLWGHWRKTDAFAWNGGGEAAPELTLERRFPTPEKILAVVGTVSGGSKEYLIMPEENSWSFRAETPDLAAETAEFYRYQENPFHSQFLLSLKELVSFQKSFPYVKFLNFGRSPVTREEISEVLIQRIPVSLALMLPVFLGETLIGMALAMLACAFKGTLIDRTLLIVSVAGLSLSYLVAIIFCQWFFGYRLNWFPVWGWNNWRCLPLPAGVGILCGLGTAIRYYRSCFINGAEAECLRTARAMGVSPVKIHLVYLLRISALPIIAYATAALPYLFTGSLLLESFFGIPGLGAAGIDALQNSDLQMLKALVLVSALVFVVINLLAEFAYRQADPRLR